MTLGAIGVARWRFLFYSGDRVMGMFCMCACLPRLFVFVVFLGYEWLECEIYPTRLQVVA